jgi:L-iditol 2-dehydrogenase
MKALVLEANEKVVFKDVKDPKRFSESACLVKVAGSGICGSDIPRAFKGHAYHYPVIMGHEFSGVVEESFTGSDFKRGERVTAFPLLPCGTCIPCQTGKYAQCTDYNYFGSRTDGAFAEYISIPEKNLFRLPDHVNLIHAAMTEPCAVAFHGVSMMDVRTGSTGVVIGAGPIGNMIAQWLRIAGCRKIIIADIDDNKLDIANGMGFETVNSAQIDPVEYIYEATHGNGADCAVEAVGLPSTLLQTIQASARFGQVVFLGNISGTFSIPEADFSNILRKELKLFGTWNSVVTPKGKDEWTAVLSYLDKELQVAPLISHTPKLINGPDILDIMANKKEPVNKVIFDLTAGPD